MTETGIRFVETPSHNNMTFMSFVSRACSRRHVSVRLAQPRRKPATAIAYRRGIDAPSTLSALEAEEVISLRRDSHTMVVPDMKTLESRVLSVLNEHPNDLIRADLCRLIVEEVRHEEGIRKRPVGVMILLCVAESKLKEKIYSATYDKETVEKTIGDVDDVVPAVVNALFCEDPAFVEKVSRLWRERYVCWN
jgi:hypothetical protein